MSEFGIRRALLVREFRRSGRVRIIGEVLPNATRFDINFRSDPNKVGVPVPFHLAFHINNGTLVANYFQNGWSSYHTVFPNMPIKRGCNFEVVVECKPDYYEVSINGRNFCSFKHHLCPDIIKAIEATDDVSISSIAIEQCCC